MNLGNKLTKIGLLSAMALSGCEQRIEIPKENTAVVTFVDEGEKFNIVSISTTDIEGLVDINRDNLPDIIYAINIQTQLNYHVFYKKGMDDGTYANPQYLFSSRNRPKGIPFEITDGKASKYYLELIKKANSFMDIKP